MIFALVALSASLGAGIVFAITARLAALDGLWIGGWLFIAGCALVQITAPGRMIKWRERMMAGGPDAEQRLGQAFSNAFRIGRSTDSQSKRNMRLVGLVSLAAGTGLIALMWWAFHLVGIG